ncbi:unnamed protein product [Rotaria magnacalcarata]|uniref:RIB43A-like with coiled-coils protein 2 n=1 Tax=Rotaria magnacalcarata TaxID=392030 RepID=A0A8S2NG82_9BILA|nr:unnamed protein product [Rotaria magnacalcarata]
MYKLDLPIDIKEKAAIERRRRAEKERQGRIFNAKQRQIGVDKEALGQQVQDRNWMQDLEEKRAAAFAKDSIRNDTIAQLLERRQQFDERENIRALNEFLQQHAKLTFLTSTLIDSIQRYRRLIFRENQERRALKKRQEEYDNFAEMANLVSGDLLSENPDQAISQFGPHRVVPDRWKGMNAEQLRRIREEQQKQLEEKKRRDEEEQQRQNEWDQRRIAEAKAGMIAERQIERERRAQELNLYNDNQRLSNEQRNLKAYLDRVVYTNQPTAAYFTQFNSSSR